MIRGMHAAVGGMVTMLTRVETISNNLANVETTGFKEDLLRLTTYPAQEVERVAGGPGGSAGIGAATMGVLNESVLVRFTQGSLQATESPLDVALQGTGFFAVQTPDGVRYTRDGSFQRDGDNRLVTSRGDLVLDPGGAPIVVPPGAVTILGDGEIRVDDQAVGQLGVFDFADPGQLRKTVDNLFEDPTGQAVPAEASTIHQGFLEGSNVDPARAMADLLVAQRSYEASARMVQLQDDMLGRAVNDVGRV
ncbi:MAG: flagellar basal-body rod protein FlgF [Chloroflexota bacterium]